MTSFFLRSPVVSAAKGLAVLAACWCTVVAMPRPAAAQARSDEKTLTLYDGEHLSPGDLDPNGFLFNPRWLNGAQYPDIDDLCAFRTHSEDLDRETVWVEHPHCLSRQERHVLSVNGAAGMASFGFECVTSNLTGKIHGHVNWFPVTVSGRLRWHGFSAGAGDHDVNIDLAPKLADTGEAPSALTSGNVSKHGGSPAYHLEFYREETLGRLPQFFKDSNPPGSQPNWWQSLAAAVPGDEAVLRKIVDNRFAIVTGLFGLDAVHNFQAELHPVYTMAVLIRSTQNTLPRAHDEVWAIMVRNRGTEGDCASGTIPMFTPRSSDNNQHYAFDLGARIGADSAQVSADGIWASAPPVGDSAQEQVVLSDSGIKEGPKVRWSVRARFVQNRALYVDVVHPRATPDSSDFLLLGTILVRWYGRASNFFAESNPARTDSRVVPLAVGPFPAVTRLVPAVPPKRGLSAALTKIRSAFRKLKLDLYPTLQQVRDLQVHQIDTSVAIPAAATVPSRAQRWILQDSVFQQECSRPSADFDRICMGKWEIGGTYKFGIPGARASGSLSTLINAHTWSMDAEGDPWETAEAIITGFTYRFEAEVGDYFPHAADHTVVPYYFGASGRTSLLYGPLVKRITPSYAVEPYLVAGQSFTLLAPRNVWMGRYGWNFGGGLEAIGGSRWDVFLEAGQYHLVSFQPVWRFSAGLMFSPRLLGPDR